MIGIDTSEAAIGKAKQKVSEASVKCSFVVADFLRGHVEGAPFGFVFDRGCFHSLASDNERHSVARQVGHHLEKGGLWLSLIGNADEQRLCPGPPQRTAREIVTSVEPPLRDSVAGFRLFWLQRPRSSESLDLLDEEQEIRAVTQSRKILAHSKDVPGVTDDRLTDEILEIEARKVWELYQSGTLRELYLRADKHQAVLVPECDNADEARQQLSALPLMWPV